MPKDTFKRNERLWKAFQNYEASERLHNTKVGCFLVMTLMPLGTPMDYYVYPAHFSLFLKLRVCSALIAAGIWASLYTPLGRRSATWLGVVIPMVPVFFIAWMIAVTEGFLSPYYAGLNLVLLAVGAVLRWTFRESLFAVSMVLIVYICTGLWRGGDVSTGVLLNNFFFLICMDVIVVVGTYFQYGARFREFALRFELDENKRKLEENNVTLDAQNKELGDTIQKLTEAESQLVQSEKMASLGRMSAGIIHEINNPLNFATTGIFTLKKKAKHIAPEQLEEYNDILKDVEEGISRVKNIVSDLRKFTHPATDHLDHVPAQEVVDSALRFLSNEMKEKTTIEVNLHPSQTVRCNKNKLIHVFMNLIQNSLDAMKEKAFANGETPAIRVESRATPETVTLLIYDNGPGIPPEHLGKIFDPFYTTKDVGEGMGLGLSICYRIMQECEGRITVRTEPGKFCEFALEFPKRN